MRFLALGVVFSFACTTVPSRDGGASARDSGFVPPDGIYGGRSCTNGFCIDIYCGGPTPDHPQKCSNCTTPECPGLSRCIGAGTCIDDFVISCSASWLTAFSSASGSVMPQWALPQVPADSVAIAAGRVVAASDSTLWTPDASFGLGNAGHTWIQGAGTYVYTSSANGTVRMLRIGSSGEFDERASLDLGASAGPLTVFSNLWVFVSDGGVREAVELRLSEPMVELQRVQLPTHDGAWLPTDVLFDDGKPLALFADGWLARVEPDGGVGITDIRSCTTPVGFANAEGTIAVACTDRVLLLDGAGNQLTWTSDVGRLTMARAINDNLYIGTSEGTVVQLNPLQATTTLRIANSCVGEVQDLRLGP